MDKLFKKHAYLIIAHKYDKTFKTLLSLIDDPRNDIYIHMDKKNKSYSEKDVKSLVHYSNIYHTKRTNVTWGGYSQIRAELILLEKATKEQQYKYYHLISGEDLPIKSQDYIHNLLKKDNKEYVGLAKDTEMINWRVCHYHLFQEIPRFKDCNGRLGWLLKNLDNFSQSFQEKLQIKRNAEINFYKGSNWFSITDDFARYVVQKKDWIHSVFKCTCCGDEIFLQTLLMNSEYGKRANPGEELSASLRYIDWERGTPYVFRNEDYKELVSSNMIFARKFVSEIDSQIIDKIKDYILGKTE